MKKIFLVPVGLLLSWMAYADYAVNMTRGVSSISRDIYQLHMLIFWICVVIGIAVFGVMFYSIFHHRKSKGAKAANFHESTKVELLWTAIPVLILVVMAVPASRVLIDLETTDKSEMTVKITGYQWKWQYEYPQEKVGFFSSLAKKSRDNIYSGDKHENYLLDVDKPLVLPVDTRIRFLLTSNDVIHSWWVPELGVKQDAIPGFINDSWVQIDEPGIYRGQCAELCGKDHGFMPVVVEAVSKNDYQVWLTSQKQAIAEVAAQSSKEWTYQELMGRGHDVYHTTCVACHGATGQGVPGVFPAIAGSPIAKGDIGAHLDIVLNGKAGTAMQAFAKQLNDSDLAAVITFQRNAFGNESGDLVQPQQIKQAR